MQESFLDPCDVNFLTVNNILYQLEEKCPIGRFLLAFRDANVIEEIVCKQIVRYGLPMSWGANEALIVRLVIVSSVVNLLFFFFFF